ncbi:MAG: thioredoxin domain-containing protein [Acidimicrobiales bacterium]
MNRLASSSSAYLRQHADNPVDWWPWGPEALAHARELDRPIFLSIGYAACHWCHVMAHESFEDPRIAEALNDSFVAIKVDREERPDVDELYMAATQLVAGHGGWPMSVFLVPDGRPFMAGTYYPPTDRHGQVGFPRLLQALAEAWASDRERVLSQAQSLQESVQREITFVDHLVASAGALDLRAARQRLRDELVQRSDEHGGFGDAPKFPRPSYVQALLEFDDVRSLEVVSCTLDAMARRGLYDHLRGGFARYSVDAQWHVPHFEKMLSDQALLARVYFHAARTTGRSEWRDVARDTLRFVVNDLSVDAGYASSLDADAGGVEGSHVTWSVPEVAAALDDAGRGGDLNAVLARWRVTSPGLFEGRSIPRLGDGQPFLTPRELRPALEALRQARRRRPAPGRDEKVILEWNAMFASACLASQEDEWRAVALELLRSLRTTHHHDGHWWRTESQRTYASAGDVAWLCDAHVDAFEVTGDDEWLDGARDVADYLLTHYWDGERPNVETPNVGGGLFATNDVVTDLVARPKEIFDGATPSSHAVACRALARLALCLGDADLLCASQRLVELGATLIATHPSAVPDLLDGAGFALEGVEIVVPGVANELSDHVRLRAVARSVLITGSGSSPLLEQRSVGLAYVCRAGACQLPVATTSALDDQLADVTR